VNFESIAEVTAWEPNHSFSFTGASGPLSLESTFRFEATGEGTRFSTMFQVETGGLFKGAGPVFARRFQKQNDADFQRRKRPVGGAGISGPRTPEKPSKEKGPASAPHARSLPGFVVYMSASRQSRWFGNKFPMNWEGVS
jgi:hypothetical protein